MHTIDLGPVKAPIASWSIWERRFVRNELVTFILEPRIERRRLRAAAKLRQELSFKLEAERERAGGLSPELAQLLSWKKAWLEHHKRYLLASGAVAHYWRKLFFEKEAKRLAPHFRAAKTAWLTAELLARASQTSDAGRPARVSFTATRNIIVNFYGHDRTIYHNQNETKTKWTAMQPSAHLCAAMFTIFHENNIYEIDRFSFSVLRRNIDKFIGYCKYYEKFLTTYRRRNGDILIPPEEMLLLPDTLDVNPLEPPLLPLTPEEMAAMQ